MKLERIAALGAALMVALPSCPSWATDGRSLYREDSYQALTADRKAHKVGDLVTVVVYEDASASTSADTSTGRDADVGVTLQLPLPHTSPFHGTHTASAGTNNTFSGTGATERSGRVVAQLTVPVTGLAPNGDLIIAGTQQLEINNEKQAIHIEGRVRTLDISESNTVLSTRVAQAQLSIVGDGTVTDQQKPGWWHRLLTLFGL